ncbi:FecR family protein [Paraflavitalea pollutisoli]|uniref:FecR family protein n=1 Tax=Paraflavitalea pollutisoli TaxID=3034143 RepID=UPI0023EC13F3|nr:FecR family protein [Paraflavitalea sp. H1-2-19X]
MTPERLQQLIDKYLSNTASPEEEQELTAWYNATNERSVEWPVANAEEVTALKDRMLRNMQQAIHPAAQARVVPFYRRRGLQVAAAVLVLMGIGAAIWFNGNNTSTTAPTVTANEAAPLLPGGNKAVLTLANGQQIILDTAGNTTLAQQGTTRIIKLNNGQLAYQDANKATAGAQPLFNTIATPNGGQYEIILPDGSHVWLNAASSLRFPTAFTGGERKVQLTGEAYFEVAKNAAMPFRVYTADRQHQDNGVVEVLGTHFNVNAYEDEPLVKTTLLEGKVTVAAMAAPGTPVTLAPGKQAAFAYGVGRPASITVNTVDADEVIAWKNGIFNFNHADIRTVMRQLARWYNVEVVYEGPLSNELFEGEIPRNSTLTEVFKILELSAVHFKVEGRKVTVMP